MVNRKEFQQRAQVIEALVKKIDGVSDPDLRASTKELMQALMALHGAGLERMMEIVHQSGEPGAALIASFERDDLVKGLLLLHGLHPADLQTRILQALEKSRPYLASHGGNVELISLDDSGAVKLRVSANSQGCASSTGALKVTIEDAIYDAAPDITSLVIEGLAEERFSPGGFVPVEQLLGNGLKTASMVQGNESSL